MTLQSPEYWYKRLDEIKDLGIQCRNLEIMLMKYPEDYTELRHELQRALKQNTMNKLWIRQEIATREEMQDFPGAKNAK